MPPIPFRPAPHLPSTIRDGAIFYFGRTPVARVEQGAAHLPRLWTDRGFHVWGRAAWMRALRRALRCICLRHELPPFQPACGIRRPITLRRRCASDNQRIYSRYRTFSILASLFQKPHRDAVSCGRIPPDNGDKEIAVNFHRIARLAARRKFEQGCPTNGG